MNFTLKDLAALLNGHVEGDENITIHGLAELQDGSTGEVSFFHNSKYEHFLYTTKASAVLVSHQFKPNKPLQTNLIRVENPYTSFAVLLEEYQRLHSFEKKGIEQPAFIHEGAVLGNEVYVGAFAYISEGVTIGNNVKIYPQVYIGENSVIGDNTVILPGAKIHHATEIGKYCTIHAGAVIGSDGFGFAPQPDGSFKGIPQVGKVILQDHVSIGANTAIDRATLSATVIEQGAKLDNLIQVAHNCRVGAHTVIAAQAGMAGSSKIGKYSMVGGQVGLAGHLHIAEKTQIGAQAGINASVTQSGKTIIGSPAMDYKDFMKSFIVYRRLPDLQKRLEQLEQKLSDNTSSQQNT